MTQRLILERLTLLLLVTTVLVAVFSFVTFLATETLHWVIFARLEARFFHTFLPLCLAAIFVFSAFNAALNIGIIAESRLQAPEAATQKQGLWQSTGKLAAGLTLLLGLLLLCLFFVNRSNIQSKMDDVRHKMTLMSKRNASLLKKLTAAIEARDATQVTGMLETLATRSPSFRQVSLVVPMRHHGVTTYINIDRWMKAEHFKLDKRWRFAPNRFQLAYLERVMAQRGGSVEPGIFVRRPNISIYYPIRNAAGRMVYFLRSQHHRYGHKEYK
ncbi:MAG: hypothetical protein JRH20_08710 [Deltaproteobacteria bacterium]|nr:hypothetical protein [Deltaproteobacteria bacterium]